MALRPQSNPSTASSDGVPPELVFLGLRAVLHRSVRPVGTTGQTGWAQGFVGVDRFDDHPHVLPHLGVFGAN